MSDSQEYITVCQLMRTHGVKGYIKAMPLTHDITRHKSLKDVRLKKTNGEELDLRIEDSKQANDIWLLKFEGYDTPESLAHFVNGDVMIPESERLPAPEGEYYIDDLEDGDGFAFTGGEWYAYTDAGDKGASTISNGPGRNNGYNVVLSGSTAGNSTKYVAGVTGVKLAQGENPYDPYVALGVALNKTQTAYDLSACNEISYKYKGAAHNFKAEDTAVTDYGYHMITKPASNSWTTVTVPWDMLSQESWAKPVTLSKKRVAKFTWEIKGTQPSMNYLYVDDVRCSGMAFKPVPSPASSSSSVKSSSSVASSSSVRSSSSSIPSSSSLSSSSLLAMTIESESIPVGMWSKLTPASSTIARALRTNPTSLFIMVL